MKLYEEIKSHFTLPNAYSDWSQYRATLTNYLVNAIDQVSVPLQISPSLLEDEPLPSLAIIGAGACNDLDLNELSLHFSTITLVDSDESSLQTAKERYSQIQNKLTFDNQSLTGIYDEDYIEFCEELQFYVRETSDILNAEQFTHFAIQQYQAICQKKRQSAIQIAPAAYDYIWCFGVHSQLQSMFAYIFQAFISNLQAEYTIKQPEQFQLFFEALKQENNLIIPQINSLLLSAAKYAIFFGNEWSQTAPIEGAHQCILHLQDLTHPKTEHMIRWPFDPSRNLYYDMLIQSIQL